MLNVEIKGLDSCLSKLTNVAKQLPIAAKQGIKQGLEQTQKAAIVAKNKVILYPSEILDSEIKVEFIGDGLKGRVYTDGERVLFVEYGTGTEAEMPHIGKTSTFLLSQYTMWLLPVEKAPMDFGSSRRILIGNREYFMMFPTSPKAFFRTTAFNQREPTIEEIRKSINEMLQEEVK